MNRVILHPKNPERVCWGCDKYCPATDLACGNGTIRTMHPVELFGEDWQEWADNRHGRSAEARQGLTDEFARVAGALSPAGSISPQTS